ncbi:MAG: 6-bladed beta-propeller [Microgenomates group bacterium]
MGKMYKSKNNNLYYLFTIVLVITFCFFGLKTVYASATVVSINTDIVSDVTTSFPIYIAADSSGNVYLPGSDTGNVKKYDSQGNFLMQIGQSGSGDGEFGTPSGIAIDSNGNIFVADMALNRVQKFNSSGTFVTKWGTGGSGDGEFYASGSMGGIAVDSTGNVYVVDSYNDRIQKFTNDGVFITKWGTNGSGDNNFFFYSPSDIVIDNSGNVYISDSGNDRIKKYTQDGVYVSQFGTLGSGQGQFSNPTGLSLDPSGNIYVADYDNSRIQVFDSSFNFIEEWGSFGTGSGQFEGANDVLYGPVNNLVYVLDYAVRIQFFDLGTYIPSSTPSPTPTSTPIVTNDTPTTDICNALPPLTAPNIFNALRLNGNSSDSVILTYTPVNDRTTGYTIIYGSGVDLNEFSVTYLQSPSTGALSYTINLLNPSQSYAFKIQARNECATGPWSNYMTVDSDGALTLKPTDAPESYLFSSPTPSPEQEQNTTTVIEINGSNGKPLSGVAIDIVPVSQLSEASSSASISGSLSTPNPVEIHSITTNDKGEIEVNLPSGDYLITMSINGDTFTQQITISDNKPRITIQIGVNSPETHSEVISPVVAAAAVKITDTAVKVGAGATAAISTVGIVTTSIVTTSALIPVYQNTSRSLLALPYDLVVSLIQKLMQSMSSLGVTFFGLTFAKWKKRGNVFDSLTSKPIKGVFLIFFSKSGNLKTSYSDDFGQYEVNPVPDDYQIKAEKAGYEFPSKLFAVSSNDKYSRIYIPEEIIRVEKENETIANIAVPLDPIKIINKFIIYKNKLLNLITYLLAKLHNFFAIFMIFITGIAAYSDPNIFYKIIFAIVTTSYLIRFIVKTTNIASQFHVNATSLA